MLKIYGRANSINVRKVLWLVEEIGLEYDREDWGRGYRPTSDQEFKRINPFEVVPAIDDDGFTLRESNTIVRYLATKHARADLYPHRTARKVPLRSLDGLGKPGSLRQYSSDRDGKDLQCRGIPGSRHSEQSD